MRMREDTERLARVRAETERVLEKLTGSGSDVALLDAPALINVGDSMIWAGQLAYMGRLGHRVKYLSDMQSYDPRRLERALPHSGIVMIRGGGNFGDVWIGHQNYREKVAKQLRSRAIVQLTQSVMFRDPERAKLANEILSTHPNFTLMVRDSLSLERARTQLPDVKTVPAMDMALGWSPCRSAAGEQSGALVIARDDREASSGLMAAATSWNLPFDVRVTDWGKHAKYPARWRSTRRELRLNSKLVYRSLPSLPQRRIEADLNRLNGWNLESAVSLFSGAKAIVVDRLHAHVLALLLGIPHVVLDNDHGKISAVYEGYTGQFSTARYTTSTDEARDMLVDLMR